MSKKSGGVSDMSEFHTGFYCGERGGGGVGTGIALIFCVKLTLRNFIVEHVISMALTSVLTLNRNIKINKIIIYNVTFTKVEHDHNKINFVPPIFPAIMVFGMV